MAYLLMIIYDLYVDQSSNKRNHSRPLWLLRSKGTIEYVSSAAVPAVQKCWGGADVIWHSSGLSVRLTEGHGGLRLGGSTLGTVSLMEVRAPTQQDPRPTRQVYEEIRLAGSLHILVGKGSCSPDHF